MVSEELFDQVWIDLLRWNMQNHFGLSKMDKDMVRRNKQEIYWGRLWPDSLPKVTPLAAIWFDAFKSVSRDPNLARWEVSGRLYRTWEHAKLYQLWTLTQIKRKLEGA